MKSKGRIHYFSEDTAFNLKDKRKINSWIKKTIELESFNPGDINLIFCSDSYLLKLNQEYLNHHTLTDIITFDSSEEENTISGDIFISIDRIKENAENLNVHFTTELHRVIIHGILHLCGYTDKSKDEKTAMREKEDHYLSLQ